jgi:hypothetical protein
LPRGVLRAESPRAARDASDRCEARWFGLHARGRRPPACRFDRPPPTRGSSTTREGAPPEERPTPAESPASSPGCAGFRMQDGDDPPGVPCPEPHVPDTIRTTESRQNPALALTASRTSIAFSPRTGRPRSDRQAVDLTAGKTPRADRPVRGRRSTSRAVAGQTPRHRTRPSGTPRQVGETHRKRPCNAQQQEEAKLHSGPPFRFGLT